MVELLLRTSLREVLLATFLFLRALVEVARFPKLLLVVLLIRVLDADLSVLLSLVNSLLGVDGRETNVFSLRVKGEQRDIPLTLLVVPLRSLVKLVKFIL